MDTSGADACRRFRSSLAGRAGHRAGCDSKRATGVTTEAATTLWGDSAGTTESLWYSRCPVPTATSVALAHGFFELEFGWDGIGVRSLQESNDPAVRLAHYTNENVLMFREGGIVPPLWARCVWSLDDAARAGMDRPVPGADRAR